MKLADLMDEVHRRATSDAEDWEAVVQGIAADLLVEYVIQRTEESRLAMMTADLIIQRLRLLSVLRQRV